MALFFECTEKYAPNLLDTADIVRDAWFRKLSKCLSQPGFPRYGITSCLPVIQTQFREVNRL
jgi:hypothetical protein